MYNIQSPLRWSISQLQGLRAEVMAVAKMRQGGFPLEIFQKVVDQNSARFQMENPSVVIHVGDTCLGIHSYRYLIWYANLSGKDRKEISFFPVNFKCREEYKEFLEEGILEEDNRTNQ